MINAWFQRPDFSADDYEDVSCERVLEIWASLNVSDLDSMMYSLMEKGEDFWISGPEARKAVEVILAIYQSAKEGRPVKIG